MENKSILREDYLKISHLPTILLVLGYICYWIELYFIRKQNGLTSPLASILFILIFMLTLILNRKRILKSLTGFINGYKHEQKFTKYSLILFLCIIAFILIIVFYAHLLPPHLSQEYDALNYHISLPRQHLILGSFRHIAWSSADLFPLPVDFALAPYWFVSELPNKFPQFLFLLGLVFVSVNLVRRFSGNNFASICLIIIAIFGSHFIGIQMGTAMLDIVLSYLFLAALDSLLAGNTLNSAAEFTFFLWSKSFQPFQVLFVLFVTIALFIIYKKIGIRDISWGFDNTVNSESKQKFIRAFKETLIFVILFSVVIAAPFLIKSTYRSGTPLFPFAPGILNLNKNIDKNSESWKSILESSKAYTKVKDNYGYGISLISFIRHFWLIAVPERGVNNKYDYPVGLVYLLFLGPFLYLLFASFKKKQFAILPLLVISFWISWWFGSQQTRFLYIPILLMMVVVSSALKLKSRIFIMAVTIALMLNAVSVLRVHKNDLGLSRIAVLRAKDIQIMQMNKEYLKDKSLQTVCLDYYDIAYARFPVFVIKESLPWVLYAKFDCSNKE